MQRVRRQIEVPDEIGPQSGRGVTVAVLDTGEGVALMSRISGYLFVGVEDVVDKPAQKKLQ